ncbi:MAG TPA: DNA primase [Candidatus Eremiobacteraceae bacterium]|nr:DNA primase [Candidatus Eremiobacteraceae bacterium]
MRWRAEPRCDWVDFGAVKQAVNMEAILHYYRIPGLHRVQGQLQSRCPIHGGERRDSFRASLSQNAFQCFVCQAHGNVLDFVAAMEKCTVREAALRIQQWFDLGRNQPSGLQSGETAMESKLVRKKEGSNSPLRFTLSGLDHAHPYLAQRGVDRVTATEFGIGFYGSPGLMTGRVVIPIHNGLGQVVAYAGRAVDGESPKYKLPTGFHKSLELYNLHRALATGSNTVIVVEGYFDCMRVHQAGLPWVVALMGSSLSPEQEQILVGRFARMILVLDGDEPGRRASRTIRERLLRKCDVLRVHLNDGVQPDQLSPNKIRGLLSEIDTRRPERRALRE